MSAVLTDLSYGKSRIRLTKVTRHTDRHEIRELTIDIALEGDFASSYTSGDNRLVLPTDTMKNVAYALAREHPLDSLERFGIDLAQHFLGQHAHVSAATVRLAEQPLERIAVAGMAHPHAFLGTRSERRISTVCHSRAGLRVESGLDGLFLLKTAESAFTGFLRDRYTTLQETSDRILATVLEAQWLYATAGSGSGLDWNSAHTLIRETLLAAFAGHASLSAQHTLHAMGAAVLEACADVDQITLVLPNKHRLLAALEPFGLDNPGAVFVATDEPHGMITGTLRRA
jgi:urate oxidase